MIRRDLRLWSADLLAEALPQDGTSTALATRSRRLGSIGSSLDVGIWEAAPGSDRDEEADEIFLVLQGRGTVEFEDGSSLILRPGSLVRLFCGDRTVWTVEQRLRKLYLA